MVASSTPSRCVGSCAWGGGRCTRSATQVVLVLMPAAFQEGVLRHRHGKVVHENGSVAALCMLFLLGCTL